MRSAAQHQFLISTSDRRARVSGGSVRSCCRFSRGEAGFRAPHARGCHGDSSPGIDRPVSRWAAAWQLYGCRAARFRQSGLVKTRPLRVRRGCVDGAQHALLEFLHDSLLNGDDDGEAEEAPGLLRRTVNFDGDLQKDVTAVS